MRKLREERTRQTIRAYNRNAVKYAEKFGEYTPYREKISRFQADYLSGNADVLDVGCGPGSNAGLLQELNPDCRIAGIDLSEEMIAIARKRYPGSDFMVGDIRTMETGKIYDAVIASFCIVHLDTEETTELFRKISTALKPGGTFYLSFMEGSGAGMETTSFSEDEIFFHYHNVESIRKMLDDVSIDCREILYEPYREPDGSLTKDVFVFAVKRT